MALRIPSSLEKLFWDVERTSIDPRAHAAYIIERVLEYGDERATRWLFQTYPKRAIAGVIRKSRRLSNKSRMYWATILCIVLHREVKSTSQIWPYS